MTRKSAYQGYDETDLDNPPIQSGLVEGPEKEQNNDNQAASLAENLANAYNNLDNQRGEALSKSVHTSLAIGPSRRPKRALSPGSSAKNPIDLTSARQICIHGKFYELIDISNDEVPIP